MPESEPTAVLDAFKRNDNDSVSARAESAAAEGILAGRNAAAEKKGQRKAVAAEAAVLAIKETDAVFVLAAAGRAEPAAKVELASAAPAARRAAALVSPPMLEGPAPPPAHTEGGASGQSAERMGHGAETEEAARWPRGRGRRRSATQMSFRLARRRQSRLRNRTDNPDERRRWRTRGAVRRGAFGPKRRLRWRRPWTGLLLRRCRRTIIGHGGRRRSSSNESARPPPRNSESRRSDAPRHRGRALSRAHPPRRHRRKAFDGAADVAAPPSGVSRGPFPVVVPPGGFHPPRRRVRSAGVGGAAAAVAVLSGSPLHPCPAPCRPGAGHHRRRSACRRSLSRRRCRRQRTRRARPSTRRGHERSRAVAASGPPELFGWGGASVGADAAAGGALGPEVGAPAATRSQEGVVSGGRDSKHNPGMREWFRIDTEWLEAPSLHGGTAALLPRPASSATPCRDVRWSPRRSRSPRRSPDVAPSISFASIGRIAKLRA